MPTKKDSTIIDFSRLWLKILNDLHEKNSCIVVEGIKDKKVLLELGISPDRVICINCNRIEYVANEISSRFKCAYLFLDRDFRGIQKTHILRRMLERNSIETIDLWRHISHSLKVHGFKSIKKVEEMKKIALIFNENVISSYACYRRKNS